MSDQPEQTPQQMIATLRGDMVKADNGLVEQIKAKLDAQSLDFVLKEKDEQGKTKSTFKTYDEGLKAYVKQEIETAGEMTWEPQKEWYKTPEFMGFVTGLTAAMIGMTLVKVDVAMFDFSEQVANYVRRPVYKHLVSRIAKREIMTPLDKANHEAKLLDTRIQNIETRIKRMVPLLRNARNRIRALESRDELIETRIRRMTPLLRNARDRIRALESRDRNVRQAVQNIPNDSSVTNSTNRITKLRAEVDLLRAALA
ncbi:MULTISPECIES: hypothetical protein [unclassified Streptomyces]|uniref:hypothetical protein n=1 Tax=unclassified Streptomyces TaxID=2593676 RepID=UPI0029675DAB|nr:hypothetical protein [Streptomyces sp. SJL17-1]